MLVQHEWLPHMRIQTTKCRLAAIIEVTCWSIHAWTAAKMHEPRTVQIFPKPQALSITSDEYLQAAFWVFAFGNAILAVNRLARS